MSRERHRAREARLEARRRQVQAAAVRRERQARRQAVRTRLTPRVPRRRKRFGALSTAEMLRLLLLFLAVQAVARLLHADLRVRLVVAVLTLACLAVLVRTRRRPAR